MTNLKDNKVFLTMMILASVILVISVSVNFFSVDRNYDYALSSNKIFNLSVEKNKKTDEFVFSTKNHLRIMESINRFVSNISLIVYDLDSNLENQPEFFELLESPTDIKFGFSEINENLFKKTIHYGHNFLFSLGFDREKNAEKTVKDIENLNKLIKKYDSGLYLTSKEVDILKENTQLANLLINLKPFIISHEDECNEKIKVCFISNTKTLKEQVPLKIQEIINSQNKSNDKWFIVVKYDKDHINDIKKLINDVNSGFLNLSEMVLKQILST